jgi:hypothetical protein
MIEKFSPVIYRVYESFGELYANIEVEYIGDKFDFYSDAEYALEEMLERLQSKTLRGQPGQKAYFAGKIEKFFFV